MTERQGVSIDSRYMTGPCGPSPLLAILNWRGNMQKKNTTESNVSCSSGRTVNTGNSPDHSTTVAGSQRTCLNGKGSSPIEKSLDGLRCPQDK